jgi:hypothetical protein
MLTLSLSKHAKVESMGRGKILQFGFGSLFDDQVALRIENLDLTFFNAIMGSSDYRLCLLLLLKVENHRFQISNILFQLADFLL